MGRKKRGSKKAEAHDLRQVYAGASLFGGSGLGRPGEKKPGAKKPGSKAANTILANLSTSRSAGRSDSKLGKKDAADKRKKRVAESSFESQFTRSGGQKLGAY